MVTYINKKQKPGRKILLGTLGVIVAGGIAYSAFVGLKGDDNGQMYEQINSQDNVPIERNIDGLVDELTQDKEFANQLVQETLEELYSQDDLTPKTYTKMFELIREEAEDKPEIMDYFGENARNYMRREILDDYVDSVGNSYNNIRDDVQERTRPLLDVFTRVKDYVVDALRGED